MCLCTFLTKWFQNLKSFVMGNPKLCCLSTLRSQGSILHGMLIKKNMWQFAGRSSNIRIFSLLASAYLAAYCGLWSFWQVYIRVAKSSIRPETEKQKRSAGHPCKPNSRFPQQKCLFRNPYYKKLDRKLLDTPWCS